MAITNELYNAVRLMQQGDEQGFNYVYSQTYNYVYSRAKYVMQDEQDAIDLLQETYIQAYKNIGALEDPNNIYAWLGSITYNHGMRIFRKKKEVLLDEEAESLFDTIEDENVEWSPEETADKNETAAILMNIIDELPSLQKAALVAFYYDNMKIEDIAQAEGCSPNTIKSRLNYAKKYIKNRVEEMQKEGGYKLYSINIPAILLAIWWLSNKPYNTLSPEVAGNLYQATRYRLAASSAQQTYANGGQQTYGNGGQQAYANSGQQTYGNGGQQVYSNAAQLNNVAGTVAGQVAKKGFSLGKALAGLGLTAAVATGAVVGYDAENGEPFGIFIDKITEDDLQASVGTYTGNVSYLFGLTSQVTLTIRYDEKDQLKIDVMLEGNASVLDVTMEEPYIDGDKLRFEQTTEKDHYTGYITLEDDGTIKFYFTIGGAEGSAWGNTQVEVGQGDTLTRE